MAAAAGFRREWIRRGGPAAESALGEQTVTDLVRTDDANRMFVALDFVARRPPDAGRLKRVAFAFRPCVYKKR